MCYGSQLLTSCESQKAQELLCYLLLNRSVPHTREKLASVFWENQSTSQAKKYLRQALWQLQTTLERLNFPITDLLQIESDWIQVVDSDKLLLDTVVVEAAYSAVQDKIGRQLTEHERKQILTATDVYHGKLLDGWYHEWCLYERERLHNFYLLLLDKLVDYCEFTQECSEMGIRYGMEILRYDAAQERAHRRLMRLFYYSGNRTAALRQYMQCVQALRDELDVSPSLRTNELAKFIREGLSPQSSTYPNSTILSDNMFPFLNQLQLLQNNLKQIQIQIDSDLDTFKTFFLEK